MTPRWYALSAEDAVRKLNSNAVTGLSHKTARLRYGKKRLSGERDFFFVPRRSFRAIALPILSDFSFWMLLLTAGTLAFFENTALALIALSFLLVNAGLSILLQRVSASVFEGFSLGFVPRVKVIRDGKLLSTDYRCVVRGDIVFLSAGDVVPFDVRLISADRLSVSTYCGKDKEGKDRFVSAEKDASAILPLTKDLLPEERTNMLTAGSVVKGGSARAVVVETGNYTYVGALMGGRPLMKRSEKSGIARAVSKELRTVGLLLLLLTVPVTVLAFFLGEPRNLAVSFLTVLSLFSAVFPGWILSILDFASVHTLYRGASEGKALVRSASAADRLASTDVLMLFGRSMITDGFPHVYGIFTEGRMHLGKELRSDACRAFTEKAVMLTAARRELPSGGIDTFDPYDLYRRELLGFAGFVGADPEMLKIRYRMLEYRAPTRVHPTEILKYTDASAEDGENLLMSSPDELLFIRCTHLMTASGKEPLTFERRSEIKGNLQKYLARGCEIRSYAEKEANGDVTFLGFFAYAEIIPRETKTAASALSDAGIRTLLFLSGEGSEDLYYATASGLAGETSGIARASDFHRDGRTVDDRFGAYSVYLGFGEEEIASLISVLEENGMRTCGVAIDREMTPLTALTSVSVACGEVHAVTRRRDAKRLSEMQIDGVPHGSESSGEMKLEADVIVPRASTSGGGLPALSEAVALGRRIARNRNAILSYLVQTFGLRAGWLLPTLIGLGDLYPAVTLLFLALVVDFFAAAVIACDTRNGDSMTGVQVDFRRKREITRRYLLQGAIGALIGALLAFLPMLPALFGAEGTEAAAVSVRAVSLVLASAVLLYRSRRAEIGSGWDRPMLVWSGCVAALLLAGLFGGPIGMLIGIPCFPGAMLLFSVPAILLPFLLPHGRRLG